MFSKSDLTRSPRNICIFCGRPVVMSPSAKNWEFFKWMNGKLVISERPGHKNCHTDDDGEMDV